jgi:ASC-1-like (ASCH) protein
LFNFKKYDKIKRIIKNKFINNFMEDKLTFDEAINKKSKTW